MWQCPKRQGRKGPLRHSSTCHKTPEETPSQPIFCPARPNLPPTATSIPAYARFLLVSQEPVTTQLSPCKSSSLLILYSEPRPARCYALHPTLNYTCRPPGQPLLKREYLARQLMRASMLILFANFKLTLIQGHFSLQA